jgi:DNA polymerase-3 subunit alpha
VVKRKETTIVERSKLDSIKIGSKEVGPTLLKRRKPMRWASLHHHSTYSFLDGYGQPKDHVLRSAELGMSAMALTEHGTVSSHPKLEQAARDIGIKPLYGCELYCNGKEKTKKKNHLTVLAENAEGYRNLMGMISWAWDEGFYYEPTVTGEVLARYRRGLVVLSGCRGSLLATSLIGGKNIEEGDASFSRGLTVANRFRELLGDAYYLEVQAFPKLEETRQVNQALEKIARKLKIPLVATADVHYCRPEENEMQKILHAVRPGRLRTVEEQAREWSYEVSLAHPRSDKEVFQRLVKTGLSERAAREAIVNAAEIAERCTVELPKAAPLQFPLPRGFKSSKELFIEWLREGWRFRGIASKKNRDEYAHRLEYEVSIIEGKDFMDYFLIVSDMVKQAKDTGILVGPARGSAAASLVCYLLRITEVDPLLFPDLVFERFIDITRADLPDIDLDFDDERRHEVFEYLAEKYGREHVGQLGTFVTYKSKNSLHDVAKVYQIPSWEVETVKELLIERSSGDLRASATIEDTVEMFPEAKAVFEKFPNLYQSTKLEGMVRGMGRHSAGAIVSSEPLAEVTAVYKGVTSVDKYDAEYLNLLKIDILGLLTCGLLSDAMRMLKRPIEDLYAIPLDDPKTLEGFRNNDVTGIFQFDGRATRLVNSALVPDSFYEVCVVNALSRPGPLHNNAMTEYVDIKHGNMEPELRHPLFDRIVANTQYQVVYQEQVLRIVREIGGFDWTHAAYIRKIISRKIGDQEFNRQWARFWKGAKKRGFTREMAKKIWGMCITAGSYAFNAAHSVSYGMLAWWTMWLKIHHPLVFYTAALRKMPAEKSKELMRDAIRHGIKVLAPSAQFSKVTWEPWSRDEIIAGFDQIPGIGEKQAQAIVDFRETMDRPMDWPDLLDVKGIGPKTLENILTFVNVEDPLGVHILDRKLKKIMKSIKNGKLKGSNGRRLPSPTHRTTEIPYGRGEDTDIVWIGTVTARNLRDLYEINFKRTGEPLDPKDVRNPELREWVIMYATDGDDVLTLQIDRWRYPAFKEVVWNLKLDRDIVLIEGVKRGWAPQRMVSVRRMVVVG